MTLVHIKNNATKTRAALTLRIENNINIQEQIDNLDFKKHNRSLLTRTIVIKKMRNDRIIVTKRINKDFC